MAERTTDRYGVAQQGTSAQRPRNAWDGATYYDTTLREVITWDARLKSWFTASGRALYSASAPRMLADDFKGPDLDSRYSKAKGSDDAAVLPTLSAGAANGEVALVTAATGNGIGVDGSALAGPALAWESEEGEITFQVRAKLSAITTVWFFLGFTDVLPSTTLEEPASLATTEYTTTATDAVGFLFDTAATTDTIRAVGVKDGTDATHVNTALEPVAGTYRDYKIVIDVDGNATFYSKAITTDTWTLVATLADAVSPGVDLVPIVAVNPRTTSARTLTVDFWTAK